MLAPELLFESSQWCYSSRGDVGQTAFDSFQGLQLVQVVEKSLIGNGILDHNFRPSVDREDHRVAAMAHLFEKAGGITLEVAEGLDIFTDVKHGLLRSKFAPN